jgi:hypothetical protein
MPPRAGFSEQLHLEQGFGNSCQAFNSPQRQGRLVTVAFDLVPRHVPGLERPPGAWRPGKPSAPELNGYFASSPNTMADSIQSCPSHQLDGSEIGQSEERFLKG